MGEGGTLECVKFFLVFLTLAASALAQYHAPSSPLVTGNGFGFGIVSAQTGLLTRFYAHPYSFARPDPSDSLSEGIPTANFVRSIGFDGGRNATVEYVNDSHIIHAHSTAGDCTTFMPFGIAQPALILACTPASNAPRSLRVQWNHRVSTQTTLDSNGIPVQLLKFAGLREQLLLVPLEEASQNVSGSLAGSNAWALVSVENEPDAERILHDFFAWRGDLSAEALSKREIQEVEHWRVKPSLKLSGEKERHLWRQSEILLRVGQSREPNREDRHNHGMIVACLPDGSFSNYWVRDMAFAAVALARMGHYAEARAAVRAYYDAQPTGTMRDSVNDADYQVSVVRYFGDGSEEPFFTQEGSTNIEFDNWGEVLWVTGEYLAHSNDRDFLKSATDRGTIYANARDLIANALIANLEPYGGGLIVAADTSIWEERQKDKKHFAWSTAMAIVGLRSFADMARRIGDERTRTEMLGKVALLEKGFKAAFIRDGKLHGTLEPGIKNDIDGALLAIIHLGVVKDPALIRSTLNRMSLLKVASGGYRRVRGIYTDPAIYEYWYEKQEFVFVDLSLAEVYRQMGRKTDANALLQKIVDKSSHDHNFVPEMYVAEDCTLFHGAIGDPTGAIPMVGYGAGAFILDVLSR